MAGLMKALGRLTGQAMKTKTYGTVSKYIAKEMKLTDLRIKIKLLKRKRQRHLMFLGRTSYHLIQNGFKITNNPQIDILTKVIFQIETETDYYVEELAKRKQE